jgi:hypothetical protein
MYLFLASYILQNNSNTTGRENSFKIASCSFFTYGRIIWLIRAGNSLEFSFSSKILLPLMVKNNNLKQYFELFYPHLFFDWTYAQFGLLNFLITKCLWSMYMIGNFSISHTHLEGIDKFKHWVVADALEYDWGWDFLITKSSIIFLYQCQSFGGH